MGKGEVYYQAMFDRDFFLPNRKFDIIPKKPQVFGEQMGGKNAAVTANKVKTAREGAWRSLHRRTGSQSHVRSRC